MTTADSVLVPIQCEYYALEGVKPINSYSRIGKRQIESGFWEIEGVVFTMYDARTKFVITGCGECKGQSSTKYL